jgi:hypothetical protein
VIEQPLGLTGNEALHTTCLVGVLPGPIPLLGVTPYVTVALLPVAWQLCVVILAQLPPVHAYVVGDPDEQMAVSVIATPFEPVLGPCIEHPDGAFETTQLNTWLPAGPLSEKLSQFESLSVMPPACAASAHEKNAAPANPRTACRIQDRIIFTPE